MTLNRRQVIISGLVAGASSTLPRSAMARQTSIADLKKQFEKFDLVESEPVSIVVAGSDFNGGLLYDESHSNMPKGSYLLQPCARTDDIEEKDRIGVLPLFHIARIDWPEGTTVEQGLSNSLSLIADRIGMDAARIAIVGTPLLDKYEKILDTAGIHDQQVFKRSFEEAQTAGDGSGVFRHPEDDQIEFATAAIYYWLPESSPDKLTTYPLSQDWLEIGEISLETSFPLGAAFGLERLIFATGGKLPGWDAQKQVLLEMIDRESAGEIPPGRTMFEKS